MPRLLFVLLFAVNTAAAQDDMIELRQLAKSDPVRDFDAAKAAQDIHFIGVRGMALIVPVAGSDYEQYHIPVHVVAGTGDCITDHDQLPLTLKALDYAATYNQRVLDYLSRNKPH